MILIAVGSNLNSDFHGNPLENCLHAIELLKKEFKLDKVSKFYETEPIPKSSQPWFVNGVVSVKTKSSPEKVLDYLMDIEKSLKRVRRKKNEPRVIDLDLLVYNRKIMNNDSLILPHPRMHLRKFVMQPICDIDENWIHPTLNTNANKLIKDLANQKISNINIKLYHGKSYNRRLHSIYSK